MRVSGTRSRMLRRAGISVLATLAALALLGFTIEVATGKTLHAVTTGNNQYGTTLGGYHTTPPSPAQTPTVTPDSSTPTPTPDQTPDASPDQSPTTPAPASTTPAPTATVTTPTQTGSP